MSQLNEKLNLSISEIVYYQNLKTVAYMDNEIDIETTQKLYNALSNWQNIPLSHKITYTLLFQILVKKSLKKR